MSGMSFQQMHALADSMTASVLAGYSVCYDNMNYEDFSQDESRPFVSQKYNIRRDAQMELGRPAMRRKYGALMFLVHVRKGTGSGLRDIIVETIVDGFASAQVSGATFQDAQILPLGESGNWAVTGVEIPFYFERLR